MNIFALHESPDIAAKQHCDKHVVKMPLESAQMLCTVHYIMDTGATPPYKESHPKHPCTLWAAHSLANYLWLVELGLELCDEHAWRYNNMKYHKSREVILWCGNNIPDTFESESLTPFAMAMPEKYKNPKDPVSSYRAYYNGEKTGFAKWRKRPVPGWFVPDSDPSVFQEIGKTGSKEMSREEYINKYLR